MSNTKSTKEKILLRICLGGGLGIFPFAIYRLSMLDWTIGLMDLGASLGMLSLFAYVLITRNYDRAIKIPAIIAILAVVFSIYIKGYHQSYWLYPALASVFFLLKPKTAIGYSVLTIAIISPIIYQQTPIVTFGSILVSLTITLIFAYVFATQMEYQQVLLIDQATKDPLTGAGNRRALAEKVEQLIASFQRTGNKVTLLLLDLDDFKKINDTFGHNIGDNFLIQLTKLLKSRVRVSDSLFRFGGEEFIIVAENTDLAAAMVLADELRNTIEKTKIIPETAVTVSIGIAELNMEESNDQWIKRADNALFKAKELGKNQVYIAEK